MSTWIESHDALLSHPKTKRLMRTLRTTPNETLGILTRLWWFTMEYAPDGDLGDFSAEDIAEAVGWEGDPEALVSALQSPGPNKAAHGFLDGLLVHDWEQYGGKLYRKREADAERKRESRQRDKVPPSDGRRTDVGGTAHVEDRTGQDRQDKEPLVESPPQNGATSTAFRDVFAYWQERCNHQQAKPTSERQRLVKARFAEGYTIDQVKAAIDGCASSPHHQGVNDRGERYDDLTLICRSGSKLEWFLDRAERETGGRTWTERERASIDKAVALYHDGRLAAAQDACEDDALWTEVMLRAQRV